MWLLACRKAKFKNYKIIWKQNLPQICINLSAKQKFMSVVLYLLLGGTTHAVVVAEGHKEIYIFIMHSLSSFLAQRSVYLMSKNYVLGAVIYWLWLGQMQFVCSLQLNELENNTQRKSNHPSLCYDQYVIKLSFIYKHGCHVEYNILVNGMLESETLTRWLLYVI